MIGITAYGGYVPRLRLSRQAAAQANAWYAPQFGGRKGTRAFAHWDEDSITLAVAAARDCLGPVGQRDRSTVRALLLASDTLPFAERLNAAVVAGALDRLSHASVSGDARLEAGLRPGASLRAESVSGTLDITLPAATSARLAVETFSGGISSPVGEVQTEQYGPGKSLSARLGAGDGDIRLESFSGNVRIKLK